MDKGIIFDLDGTLWDSSKQVVESWNKAFESFQIEKRITLKELQGLMGKHLPVIAKILLPDFDEAYRTKIFDECMNQEHLIILQQGGVLYENLEETLGILLKDYKLFIVSNCQDGYIEDFLEYHKLGKYFADTECSGRTKKSKGSNIKTIIERNNIKKAMYVGDTMGDYEASIEAKIPFVLAQYGFGNVSEAVYKIQDFTSVIEKAKHILL